MGSGGIVLFDGVYEGLSLGQFIALSMGVGVTTRIVAEAYQSVLSILWVLFKGIIP
ncbi:MAG: hypothetical protein AAF937_09445 [Planctomycetota bacterium]